MVPYIDAVNSLIPSCTAQLEASKNALLARYGLTSFQKPIDEQIVTLCVRAGLLKEGTPLRYAANQSLSDQILMMNTYAPYFTRNLRQFSDDLVAQVTKVCAPKIAE